MIRAYWQPHVDVLRGHGQWCIRVELAGIRPDQLMVSVDLRAVTIRGSRRDLLPAQGFSYQSLEINYAAFERRISLPFDIDRSHVTWDYQDGMLLIRLQPQPAVG